MVQDRGFSVGVLGPVELHRDGAPIRIGAAKQRMILAILALRSGHIVSTDYLLEALWAGRPPPTARTALRVYVSELRKLMGREGGELIRGEPPGYRLALSPAAIDVRRFETLWHEGRELLETTQAEEAAQKLSAALGIWRGAALADLVYEEAFAADIHRLSEMQRACMLDRIDADLARGKHAGLIGDLEGLVAAQPLDERSRAQLMLALYRSGRQADALEVYRQGRELLVEELGIEPSPTLNTLEGQILRHHPALEPSVQPRKSRTRTILVATQASRDVESLLGIGSPLAQGVNAELILVRVLTTLPGRENSARLRELTARLSAHRERLEHEGVTARIAAFSSFAPGQDLLKLAIHQDAALILIEASRELLEGRPALAAELLDGAPCDVALQIAREDHFGERILVPFGASEHDWAALELGAQLAIGTHKTLVIAGAEAEEDGVNVSRLLATASLVLQRATGVVAEPLLLDERGACAILGAAGDANLIVLGLSNKYASEGLGDTRMTIAQESPASCLFVRRGSRPGLLAPPEGMTRYAWSLSSQAP